jgi:hypothetical protein
MNAMRDASIIAKRMVARAVTGYVAERDAAGAATGGRPQQALEYEVKVVADVARRNEYDHGVQVAEGCPCASPAE